MEWTNWWEGVQEEENPSLSKWKMKQSKQNERRFLAASFEYCLWGFIDNELGYFWWQQGDEESKYNYVSVWFRHASLCHQSTWLVRTASRSDLPFYFKTRTHLLCIDYCFETFFLSQFHPWIRQTLWLKSFVWLTKCQPGFVSFDGRLWLTWLLQ